MVTEWTSPGVGAPYTIPTDGPYLIEAYGAGAGGGAGVGAGRGGCGGGGGAYVSVSIDALAGDTIAVTVGAGGAGGTWGGTTLGTDGAATVVRHNGVIVASAAGGHGGDNTAGTGGQALDSTGTTRLPGATGSVNNVWNGGAGGAAAGPLGGAGGTATTNQGLGHPGTAPGGAGGGGGQASAGDGGTGATGYATISADTYVPTNGHYVVGYDTVGVTTWTAPADGVVLMAVTAGGGGGRAGVALQGGSCGGGGGGTSWAEVPVTKGEIFTITVGAGGPGGVYASSTAGQNGTDSKIARSSGTVVVQAKAGLGGTNSAGGTGGAGGSTTGAIGDVKQPGFQGLAREAVSTNYGGPGGHGGWNLGGNGGIGGGRTGSGNAGGPGIAPGGGGGGGFINTGGHGGAGARGGAVIAYYQAMGYVMVDGQARRIVKASVIHTGARRELTPYVIQSGTKTPLLRTDVDAAARRKPIPATAPAGTIDATPGAAAGNYDRYDNNPTTGRYNFHAGNTANLAAALTAGDLEVLIVGDSVSEGWTYLNNLPPFNYTADYLHAWPIMCRDRIATLASLAVKGTGLVRCRSVSNTYDTRWGSFTGATGHGHYVTLTDSTGTGTFTSDKPGTAVAVTWLDRVGAGSFTIAVDGATTGPGFVTVPNTATGAVKRTVITGLANTTHSVVIRDVNDGLTSDLVGCDVYTPGAGIKVHNVSQGGATAGGTGQPSWNDTSSGLANLSPVFSDYVGAYGRAPDLVIVLLGGNDLSGSAFDTATYNALDTALEQIGQRYAGPATDVLMIAEPHGSATFAPPGYTVPFHQRLYQTCLDNDWPLVDMEWLTGGFEALASPTLGYTGDTYGHLNVTGATWFGQLMAPILLAAAT